MTKRDDQAHESARTRGASILVVTSPLMANDALRESVASWRGQRVLLSLAGSGTVHVDADWVVIDCYDPYENVAHLLCRAMGRVRHLFRDLDGPFLFVGHPRADIPGMGAVSASTVRFEESRDGELTLLAVGDAVASGGLLGDFFRVLAEHEPVDSRTLVGLLTAALSAEPA